MGCVRARKNPRAENKSSLAPLTLVLFGLMVARVNACLAEENTLAPIASMNEQVLSVPGDPQPPALLQVTVLKPDGPGPFPLAVMNHGASGKTPPDQLPRYRYTFSAYYFLSRGYAVVLPMMRGYAGSQGKQIYNGCNQEALGLSNAEDIRAVIDYMATRPYIDGHRIVVAGQSFGGWNTLAFGTLDYPGVKGLISFAGGAIISNCASTQLALAQAAEHYGARTAVPSIWFYGDNDAEFSPPVWHAMFDRYTAAGGKAKLVAFGRFMTNSHELLSYPEGLRIWGPEVDAFLSGVGLPSTITHPEYLPVEFPPATHYADVEDVNAVPYLNDSGRETYRKFLADPMPKVFVFSTKGLAATFNGGFDPLGRALSTCQKYSQKCQVYAVDNEVTWVRPTPAPPATDFAPLDDVDAVPYLPGNGHQGYEKYLTLRNPKAFVIAPDGGWAVSALGDDPLASAMGTCEKTHRGCRFYAVDDRVVWSEH